MYIVCVFVWGYVHVSVGPQGNQKRVLDGLELECGLSDVSARNQTQVFCKYVLFTAEPSLQFPVFKTIKQFPVRVNYRRGSCSVQLSVVNKMFIWHND